MKKFLIMLLAFVLLLSVTACGSTGDGESTTDGSTTAGETSGEAGDNTNGVLSYAEYMAAEVGDVVTIEAYVQATQGWWDNTITAYLQDENGAYFVYGMACTEADAERLTSGVKIRVTGDKAEWNGEIEITNGTFEFVDGAESYIADATDVTALLGTDDLITHQNKFVAFTGMTVEAIGENGETFYYKWDNSGADGDDLYFKVSDGTNSYTFTVESYLTGAGTEVYEAVKTLKAGDVINMRGFLYWYEGVNPHITSVTVVTEAE